MKNINVDATDWLYSNKLRDSILIPNFDKNHTKGNISLILSNYGIRTGFNYSDHELIENYENWKKKEFPKIYEQMKFTNSIGIYWLGYSDEKIKAKKFLKKFSGKDFDTPEEYLHWYWIKYFGCDY